MTHLALLSFTALGLVLNSPPARAMDYDVASNEKLVLIGAKGALDEEDLFPIRLLMMQALKKSSVALEIDMTGGSLEAAPQFADLIVEIGFEHSQKYGRPLALLLPNRCFSACTLMTTILTSQALPRDVKFYIGGKASFGMHGPTLFRKGKELKLAKNKQAYKHFVQKVIDQYTVAGLNPAFQSYLLGPELKVFTAKEICEGRSMVVPPSRCLPETTSPFQQLVNDMSSPEPMDAAPPNAEIDSHDP